MEGPFQPGTVLAGKYVVERLIGKGGSGFVLAAQHLVLKQRVAVKLLHDEVAGIPEATARFLREAQTVARLTSANTVRIMDADRLEGGRPYIVMEYLQGRDLRTVAKEAGRLDARTAASYVAQACEGIAEAHARGVIHRDLKPSNLFLTTDGSGRPLVKVLDFGVSKLSPGRGELLDDLAITRTFQVFGSSHFMSPEQMRSTRDTDARTDIWSLGATLFVLVTARYPFEGDGLAGLQRAIHTGPRPTLHTDIPPELAAIVERCLQPEPSGRYATARDLGLALSRFASDERSHTAASGDTAAVSPGWGPIVIEQANPLAARESTKMPVVRVATAAVGACMVAAGVWLLPGIAHRTQATGTPGATPQSISTALPTAVAAPATSDSAPAGTVEPPGRPSTTSSPPSSAAPSVAARAPVKPLQSGVEQAARRTPSRSSTERASAMAAPRAASAGDTTLRDFDVIHNLPRR